MAEKPALVIIGFGRLGRALAGAASQAGYPVAAVTAATAQTQEESMRQGWPVYKDNAAAAAQGDLILLCVPDRAIVPVCCELVAAGRLRTGQFLLHVSGASDAGILAPARTAGVAIGAFHPLQSFSDARAAAQSLPGSAFAIDGDPPAVAAATTLARNLGGRTLAVPPPDRGLYHAAAVMTSNYLVTLLSAAELLLTRWAPDEQAAREAVLALAEGTLRNIRRQGTKAALTGPIVRGDAATIEKHLQSLPESLLPLYQQLGLATLSLAKDSLSPEQHQALQDKLQPQPTIQGGATHE